MAGIGKAGSYATTNEPKDYVSDALARVEDQAFKYRAEKRLLDKEKQDKKDAVSKDIADGIPKTKGLTTTKFPSLNALAIDGADKIYNKYMEDARRYEKGEISKIDFEASKAMASEQVSLMNQSNKRINEQEAEYAKLASEKKIAEPFIDQAMSLGKAHDDVKMYWEMGENGKLELIAYDDTDPDDVKIIERGGLEKFGSNSFTPVFAYDLGKDQEEFVKRYPKSLQEEFVGMSIEGKKGISPIIKEALDLKVQSLIKNKDVLANEAYKITGVANPNVTDKEVIKKVEKNLTTEYEALYSPDKTLEEATSRFTATKPDKSSNKDTNEPASFGGFTVIKGRGNGVDINGVRVQENTRAIPITNDVTIGSPGGRQERATRVLVSPGGKMYLEVERTGFETSSTTKVQANEKGKAKLKSIDPSTKKPYTIDDLLDDEKVKVTTADKNSGKVLLDFGQKSSDIAKFAKRMGYPDMDTFTRDMIAKSGGDTFFKVQQKNTNAKKTTTTKKRTYKGLDLKGNPIFE